jgi:hypothetical protein
LLIGVRSFGDIVLNWYIMIILIVVLRYLGVRRQARTHSAVRLADMSSPSVTV